MSEIKVPAADNVTTYHAFVENDQKQTSASVSIEVHRHKLDGNFVIRGSARTFNDLQKAIAGAMNQVPGEDVK